jgi:hypothetical protein
MIVVLIAVILSLSPALRVQRTTRQSDFALLARVACAGYFTSASPAALQSRCVFPTRCPWATCIVQQPHRASSTLSGDPGEVLLRDLSQLLELVPWTELNQNRSGINRDGMAGCHVMDLPRLDDLFMVGVADSQAPGEQVTPVGALAAIIRQTLQQLRIVEIRQVRFVAILCRRML